ncbi:response regulator transcription factor [Steroidobacter sp. S1-65]|uniref:Response regulator transcription factor n=1 Tax=Steroidobacter gossypii TaxID=2805490 RepID=A0ABS1WQK2_9GAMM|nr:LuxR C-terminal-related transcriptional regulator [Steroidobacter gossypii]MBM0103254.1 response regulator transcription factor [Steroidobacter gossypii]
MSAHGDFIYVVNENARTRDTLCEYLEGAGLAAIACSSAAEFTTESAAADPACVILDVDLPDMSGLDLQAQLATMGVPTLFVAARVDIAATVRAIKAGAVDFLLSPLPKESLLQAVHSALDQYRRMQAARAALTELQRRHRSLTPRESQVMQLIVSGLMNKQVARELGITEITVQIHRGRIMQKMGARSFAHLVRMAQSLEQSLV